MTSHCTCVPAVRDGHHYVQWIGSFIRTCAYTPNEIVGVILGLMNIVFWIGAQFPQLYLNWKNSRADSLSPSFLFLWLCGDIGNFIGCIYTNQSEVQLYTAIYFLTMDVFLISQSTYYQCFYVQPSEPKSYIEDYGSIPKEDSSNEDVELFDGGSYEPNQVGSLQNKGNGQGSVLFVTVILMCLIAPSYLLDGQEVIYNSRSLLGMETSSVVPFVDRCDYQKPIPESEEMIGYVAAWTSGLLYFTSRWPQIYRNYQRKTAEGLSMAMFLCAILGNTSYGFSMIFAGEIDFYDKEFYNAQFAFFLGSLLTVCGSLVVLWQFWYYGIEPEQHGSNINDYEIVVDSEEEIGL